MFLTTQNLMNRFTYRQTHTHSDIMDDKEKVRKALAKITKIIDQYESWNKDPDVIKQFKEIRNRLSNAPSDEIKIKRALAEIYEQLISLTNSEGTNYEQITEIKKVKKILGVIPEFEERYQIFVRKSRDWAS